MELKKIYGKMIIKKGSILYHTSDNRFKENPNKPMLFCTFHPSEWDAHSPYITFIKLKRNVKLLFMVDNIVRNRVLSSLNSFINHKNGIMSKKYNNILKLFVNKLKEEKFDGWFTSIEDKSAVEVALINNNNIFEIEKTERLKKNWRNGNIDNNKYIQKKWGEKYPVCSISKPIYIKLNIKYKQQIKDYIKYCIKTKFPYEHVFHVILNNAIIEYYQ